MKTAQDAAVLALELQGHWLRREQAVAWREAGETFARIGERLGVTPGRARQMVEKQLMLHRWGCCSPLERWHAQLRRIDTRDWLTVSRKSERILREAQNG